MAALGWGKVVVQQVLDTGASSNGNTPPNAQEDETFHNNGNGSAVR